MGLIGRKLGMTQIYDDSGKQIPVTAIRVGPCTVLEIKNKNIHGYNSIKLGFEEKKERIVPKPELGFFDSITKTIQENGIDKTIKPKKFVREFRIQENEFKANLGDDVTVDYFNSIKFVDIIGKTKGRGFTGIVKRFNAQRGRMTHGSKFHRGLGGVAMCEHPGRVYKGTKMAGQYGNSKVTVQNLEVVKVLKDENILLVKGAIPGGKNNIVLIKRSLKRNK